MAEKTKKYKIDKLPKKRLRGVWAIKPVTRVAGDRRRKALKRIEEREKREQL
jgi:hypothetical protein